ncbi:Biotin synthesis protein bioZ [Liberibacter crescens BT-1]|uniref:3-oxopimeloyl-[acyl-carrier-protein] synthase n=1 Tax=Liberibacter crescens (strain BT-1) TaxID=1215343 RepID=L0EWS9_LIBCB|nr:beta-ketoacyl-ACP synthase III [Liberibacter crescens]AGA65320.1 Biotin synthesis protein bioZ [Liberibacter crescens BT-1]AMC13249.1 3-oxoacyl-ACP synthase [Liberibacter crescens]
MMKPSSRILGFGHSVPEKCINNSDIELQLGLNSGWIERRTGIQTRWWASPNDTLTDLAARAAEEALNEANIHSDEITLTILATSTPDQLLPPSAPFLAHKLGLVKSGAIDLSGACSGFLYGLVLADSYVKTHNSAALVVAANILSRRINMNDKDTAIIFGDAAGAIILAPSSKPKVGVLGIELSSDGSQYDLIKIPAGGSTRPFSKDMQPYESLMTVHNGQMIFSKAVEMMVESSKKAMQQAGLNSNNIDRFIPHQANARIINTVCKHLDIPNDKTVQTIREFGNSSAATIPLSLSLSNKQRPFIPGERLLLAASGAGMISGAVIFVIN